MKMASAIRLSLPLLALLTSQVSSAAGIDVRSARLADVVDTYYRVVSNAPYVLCPAVTGALGRVSVRAPANMTRQALQTLLRVNGFSLRRENGIDVVCDLEQTKGASVTPGTIEPYGPPANAIPSGSPLSQPVPQVFADAFAPDVETLSPASIAAEPVEQARFVYRVRHRAAEELLPMLQSLGMGTFSVLGMGTARVDGSTSSSLGGQAGDMILWAGAEDDEKVVRELVSEIDQPAARAYVEIAAIAVSDVESRSRSLALVGELLGIGADLGSAGGGASIKVGGLGVNFDALETSRDLHVVKRWSGFVTSGRSISTLNGGSVPVVSEITESSTGRVTQGVSYQPTGLSMNVSPTVLEEVVRLAVDFQDRAVVGGTTVSPSFETRELRADMELCFGCVSVVSSLDDQTTDRSKDRFLGILPIGSRSLRQQMKLVYVAFVRERAENGQTVSPELALEDPRESGSSQRDVS